MTPIVFTSLCPKHRWALLGLSVHVIDEEDDALALVDGASPDDVVISEAADGIAPELRQLL